MRNIVDPRSKSPDIEVALPGATPSHPTPPQPADIISAMASSATPASTYVPLPAMETLLGIMQHVVTILEQAVSTHRGSWKKLAFLGERHAAALSHVKMLRCYDKSGEAAIHYLNEDLGDLLRVPNLAEQMRASLQGRTRVTVALHFLRGLEADLQLN